MVGTVREDMLAGKALHGAWGTFVLVVVAPSLCLGCSNRVDRVPLHYASTRASH
jgi:hypothetical protein